MKFTLPAPHPTFRKWADEIKIVLTAASLGTMAEGFALDPHTTPHWVKTTVFVIGAIGKFSEKALDTYFNRTSQSTATVRDETTGQLEQVPVSTPPAPPTVASVQTTLHEGTPPPKI